MGENAGTNVALRAPVVADLLFSVENVLVFAGGLALLGLVLTAAGWGGLLAIVALELTELVFTVDSVPGVFAVSDDPLVGIASNVLALAGLRWVTSPGWHATSS